MGEFQPSFSNDRIPASFTCNCSKQRMERALISLGRKEIKEMIQDKKSIEINCHFCNTHYNFSVEELQDIEKNMGKS